jgi:hypothetical protein
VSIPLDLAPNNTVDDVLGDDLGPYGNKKKWRMFQYTGGSNVEVTGSTPLLGGRGYWLIVKDQIPMDIGQGTTYQQLVDNLSNGWYLVGNPFPFDIYWPDVQSYSGPSSTAVGPLRVFEGGSFVERNTLKAYEGGFFMGESDNQIVIPVIKNSLAGGRVSNKQESIKNPLNSEHWEVQLTIKNGERQYDLGGVGMNANASIDKDPFDEFTLPRFIEYVEINHAKKFHNISFSKDIVPLSENQEWEFVIEANTESDWIDLGWDNSYFGANSKELALWDEAAKRAIDMRMQNQYRFSKSRSGEFKVFFGSREFINEKTSVDQVILHPVYPNPAADQFVVSFTLPQQGNVVIELFDMLGRKINTVTEASFEAGYHEVPFQFKGMAGMYVIQLSTGHSRANQRLMIKD